MNLSNRDKGVSLLRKTEFTDELRQLYISSYYLQLDVVKAYRSVVSNFETELKLMNLDSDYIDVYHQYLVLFERFLPQLESVVFSEDDFIANDHIADFKDDWALAMDDLKSLRSKCDREIAKAYFDDSLSDMHYLYIKKAYKLIDAYLQAFIEAYKNIQSILSKQKIFRKKRPYTRRSQTTKKEQSQ
jgi:hypothetical protein